MTSAERLALADEAERRAEAATPGPWHRDDRGAFRGEPDECTKGVGVVTASAYPGQEGLVFASDADASFVAAARADVPALVAALREAEAERERWEKTAGAERAYGNARVAVSEAQAEAHILGTPQAHARLWAARELRDAARADLRAVGGEP